MKAHERNLLSHLLEELSEERGNAICNDVDDLVYKGWTLEQRRQFVKEFHEYNGDPEEYNENFLHIPDFALYGFLAYKIQVNL